ncbi:IPT/TIG domain-containing protein [Pontibacter sp. JH31]|uniref:IPT/TIG domain-containing protein n=1 Tax=Pontibacter aquaedesilientis TaxID=2766980 RepID=A0ABR7XGI3_9BACT|nr:IPT/TIG domain-containing protein [Pontibacter aquaedesilientis]MBD1397389.1 IPT/TIG domain-containing protein [Pontibacter aquaedesilientis]
MAQLYNPPFNRLICSLLLQCVMMLGLAITGMAQTYPDPLKYDGPWRVSNQPNVTSSGLSSDGLEISPSTSGGSAQLRTTTAFVDIKLHDASQVGTTGYKVSFSLIATAPADMQVNYRLEDGSTVVAENTYPATTVASRHNIYLPSNATNVIFKRAELSSAYLFLDAIEVSQQPELVSFNPATGIPTTEVTITGVHLDETSNVFFGAIAAVPTSKSSTQVVVAVPRGAISAPIKVVTPYGEATSGTDFMVPKPEFAKAAFTTAPEFSPSTAGPGETVVLNGRYFTDVRQVLFNGVNAPDFVVVDDKSITVTVPLAATSGPITLNSPAGNATSSTFTVLGPQIIAQAAGEENEGLEFSPATGPVGTEVTIYGKYFLAVSEVLFNNAAATFTALSDNKITATVPVGARTGFITVKSPAGQALTATEFELPAPAFADYTVDGSQFLPTSAGPGMQVTLFGTNLASASRVVFLGDELDETDDREGTIVTPLTSTSDTELAVLVPADAKSGLIRVIAPGMSNTEVSTTSTQEFTFVPAPTIASVATTDGGLTYALVGEEVTITGTNFQTATTVALGNATIVKADPNNSIEGFTVNTDGTTITFNIPATATTGKVTVTTLGGEAEWDGTFDVILAPVITAVDPIRGPIGRKIKLSGENLKYVTEVTFLGDNGVAGPEDVRVSFEAPNASDSELVFVVPVGAETGKLLVTNPADGTETALFTVVRNPEILTITPNKGIAGTEVTITGYNFLNEGTTTVTFAGTPDAIPADNLSITTDSTMTVNVPAGAVTGVITASNSFGSGESAEFFIFQLPTITSFTPERGIVGNQVTISGTNFYDEGMVVTFLGVDTDNTDNVVATNISVNVAEQTITATVPAGAVTGQLMVTNPAGDSAPSTESYEVVTTAEILSFTPTEGKVTAPVTISGWLMQNVTDVAFNGTKVTVTPNADGKTINTAVPASATTGPLSLYEGTELVFTTTEIFTVIPAPTIYSFNPTSGVAETEVTITGTNFEGITEVLFNGVAVEDLSVTSPLQTEVIDNVTYQKFTVKVPNDATTGFITITAAGGTVVSDDEFVVPVPANITFTPQTSYANQLVTINGNFFKNIQRVTFNGVAADIDNIDITVGAGGVESFTVKAPFDAGTGPIVITTSAGEGTSASNYTVIEPVITSTSVNQGYADRTVITLTGDNFTKYWDEVIGEEADGLPIVEFQGVNSRVIATVEPGYTNTSITVTVPANARSGGITVRSGSGVSAPFAFTVLAPTISAVNPTAVYAGERVTVTGTNYVDVTSVSYGGVTIAKDDVTGYKVIDENTIEFVAPFMPVSSTNSLGITTLSGTTSSTLLTVYKPIVASIVRTNTSSQRVYAGVSTVTITGTRFDEYYDGNGVNRAAPSVTFTGAGSTRVSATIQSATYSSNEAGTDVLVVEVPANALTGRVQVTSGSGTGQSAEITIIGAPTIASFSPAAEVVGGSFTITGTNLDEATSVTFLGREEVTGDEFTVNAAGFTSNTSSTITLNVPAGAVAGKIMVSTPRTSNNTATSSNVFRIVKAPVITSIDETEQQATKTITIRGANLWDVYTDNPSGAIKVWFKGHGNGTTIPAPADEQVEIDATVNSYDLVNGDWVIVTVPRDAITGFIRVENAAGQATTASEFNVTSPVIVRFEKVSGIEIKSDNRARIDETVLIRGYQLKEIGSIRIGSQNVISFKEAEGDPTTAEIVIPRGARTNPVQVTSLGYTETSSQALEIGTPTIVVTPTSLSFKVNAGEISESKSYKLSAQNLAMGEDLEIAVLDPNNFVISLDEINWNRGFSITPDESGNVAERQIFVRNEPGADASVNQTGRVANSSFDATTRFVALNSTITPLPVELIAFNATKQSNGVQLDWATASEQDNDYFEVQMTEDLKSEFKTVGKVKSKVGTTSIRQDYQFVHKGNFAGTRYYRLKQVDLDGTSDYSKVVAVSANDVNLAVGPRVYPNPIQADSKLEYNAETDGKLHVRVVNMNGTAVYNQSYDIAAGSNTIILNMNSNLPKGIYILMAEFNGKTEQVKLLKQ